MTSAGGREHFLVFASPDRLESLEQAFAALPSPQENAPVVNARLEPRTIERLRSVGGLTPESSKQNAGSQDFAAVHDAADQRARECSRAVGASAHGGEPVTLISLTRACQERAYVCVQIQALTTL